MSYRYEDPMKCDCGGDPVIVQVFWVGMEREHRRCHLCCPEYVRSEVRVRDPETGAIIGSIERLQMRWGDQQADLLESFRASCRPPEPKRVEPRTWKDRLRDFIPELRNFRELMFWRSHGSQ